MDPVCGVPLLRQLFQFGHAGVDVFFVLSGFIILFVHFEDVGRPARLGHYAARRFTRVMPVYWVALAITVGMGVAGGHGWPGTGTLLWSALLLPSWADPLLGVAWTLQYEVVFYAAFAVLIISKQAGVALLAAWFAYVAAITLGVLHPVFPPSLASAYTLEFFFGMAVAFWLKRAVMPVPRNAMLLGILFLVMCAVREDAGSLDGYGRLARLAYGLPAAVLVLGLADPNVKLPGWVARPLGVLGTASYSIYLFQFVWIGAVWQGLRALGLDHALPCSAGVLVLAASAIAGGILLSVYVEYPLMRAVRSVLSARQVG